MLHAHLLGRKVSVRVFRGDKELLLAKDDSYDFNFQETRHLKEEFRILPVSISGDLSDGQCLKSAVAIQEPDCPTHTRKCPQLRSHGARAFLRHFTCMLLASSHQKPDSQITKVETPLFSLDKRSDSVGVL